MGMADSPERAGSSAGSGIHRVLLALVVAAACGLGLLWTGLPEAFSPVGQWDFDAYYYALKVYDAGGNPWNMAEVVKMASTTAHHFIYPPHTFAFFRLFAFDDIAKAKDAYLIARLACLAVLLPLWAICFVRSGARGWFLAFAALGFNATICRDLVVGNVSIFEQVPIWLGLWALLRGRLALFCGLIILGAQFKMLPASLLLLVLVTDSPRKWAYLLGSVVACALVATGVYWADPRGAKIFLNLALEVGTMEPGGMINPGSHALIREVLDSILHSPLVFGDVPLGTVVNAVYVVFAAVVLVVYWWAVRRGMELRAAIYTGILTYVLLAPRMKDYAYIIAIVPTFELIRMWVATRKAERLVALTVGAIVLLAMPGLEMLWQYRPLVLAAWAWAVGVGMAGEEARRSDSGTIGCACGGYQ
jgi:hypothetical protein